MTGAWGHRAFLACSLLRWQAVILAITIVSSDLVREIFAIPCAFLLERFGPFFN